MERIRTSWEALAGKWKIGLIGGLISLIIIGIGGAWWFQSAVAPPVAVKAAQKLEPATVKPNQTKPRSSSSSKNKAPDRVVVDVKGAVKQPGVYTVATNTRVDQVIRLAGGFLPSADANQVNLAQKATDQSILYVPNQGEKPPMGPNEQSASPAGPTSDRKVNLNQADATQLQSVSGIGAKKAEKIVAYRQQTGNFKTVDELKNVPGFGAKTVTQLASSLTV
ncbi:helix-hairpin-helix domain-containing protein [Fructilactobacillus ixorae]|uniref:Helix-hairpin-helix domain-containing protein n=1 Tax=Fructilactobacillus ixorae TaxID=1750535 RepID=A0ABY5C270_9LACO|nr:helix-hairpin-helix domain-containing protein [Fructilactobacillus ixorae]USS92869.1 helix-hairpin-helix domain-containing protein [Fructilactobacillus ixorae]